MGNNGARMGEVNHHLRHARKRGDIDQSDAGRAALAAPRPLRPAHEFPGSPSFLGQKPSHPSTDAGNADAHASNPPSAPGTLNSRGPHQPGSVTAGPPAKLAD